MSTAEILAQLPKLVPEDRAAVRAKLEELNAAAARPIGSLAGHPAVGIWKDRTDLPDDPTIASQVLRDRMTRPARD